MWVWGDPAGGGGGLYDRTRHINRRVRTAPLPPSLPTLRSGRMAPHTTRSSVVRFLVDECSVCRSCTSLLVIDEDEDDDIDDEDDEDHDDDDIDIDIDDNGGGSCTVCLRLVRPSYVQDVFLPLVKGGRTGQRGGGMEATGMNDDDDDDDEDQEDPGDRRFLCSICLDIVSDEPVVTRCGHLYCWSCLYTWLEPGIADAEFRAAFGGDENYDYPSVFSDGGGGRRVARSLLLPNPPSYSSSHSSSSARRGTRRCCPVCKAECTVDSVVPIYVHLVGRTSSPPSRSGEEGKAERSSGGSLDGRLDRPDDDDDSGRRRRWLGGDYYDDDDDDRRRDNPATTPGRRRQWDRRGREASPPPPPPARSPSSLERRRRPGPANADDEAEADDDGGVHDTPIHRNTGRDANNWPPTTSTTTGRGGRRWPGSPLRPSPVQGASTTARASASSPPRPPELDSSFSSSSPFRLGLRPRRPHHHRIRYDAPFATATEPDDERDRRRTRQRRHYGGRLTSALMMIVDAIDYAASTTTGGRGGGGASMGGEGPPRPRMPTLHRPDGRSGGWRGVADVAMASLGEEYDPHSNDSPAIMMGEEEESSLTMAREFLSRLW
ncbi:hypothetical protein ACHAW5_001045 [Stephanodiscus triporus]|uniref:RING-type E3 ubiquitin transferase n=1 Tax=Stephanodiscus triporus TaxID=2934178 RepID=A0ABD3MI73_9STRA